MSEEEQPVHSPMASPARDVRRLKQNSAAAAGELKEFLAKIQGKNPKEMMGAVASSGLFQGLVQATVAMVVLVLLLTIAPYAIGQIFGGGDEAPAAVETAETPTENTDGETGTETETPATDPNIAVPPDAMPDNIIDPAKAIDALGVGETKEAPASVNPLEGAADDLLKGLD